MGDNKHYIKTYYDNKYRYLELQQIISQNGSVTININHKNNTIFPKIGGKSMNKNNKKRKSMSRNISESSSNDPNTDPNTDSESDLSGSEPIIESKMNTQKKSAIFMFCIVNHHYILGALVAAFCHRKLLECRGIKNIVDICMICDDSIYDNYYKLLRTDMFFDRVEKLDIREFKISEKYQYAHLKYSSWIAKSLNKWQSMKYDEYERIMHVDIALLPVSTKQYDLLYLNAPSVYLRKDNQYSHKKNYNMSNLSKYCIDNKQIKLPDNSKSVQYDYYLKNDKQYGTIHGFIATYQPNRNLYDQYVTMTNNLYRDGIYSLYKSGPDETSLYYFLMKQPKPTYEICHKFAVIPWGEPELVSLANAYVFSAFYKPWIKPKVLSWAEETIWRDIYNIVIESDQLLESDRQIIQKLFKKTIVATYRTYIKENKKEQDRNYNDKYAIKYAEQFKQLELSIDNDDKLFDQIMNIDKLINVDHYGKLLTEELMKCLNKVFT